MFAVLLFLTAVLTTTMSNAQEEPTVSNPYGEITLTEEQRRVIESNVYLQWIKKYPLYRSYILKWIQQGQGPIITLTEAQESQLLTGCNADIFENTTSDTPVEAHVARPVGPSDSERKKRSVTSRICEPTSGNNFLYVVEDTQGNTHQILHPQNNHRNQVVYDEYCANPSNTGCINAYCVETDRTQHVYAIQLTSNGGTVNGYTSKWVKAIIKSCSAVKK